MKEIEFSVLALSAALESGHITAVELTEECFRRIDRERCGDSFAFLDRNGAMEAARAADRRRAEGKALGALDGVPFAAEDRFCVKGMPTENHCRMLRGYRPLYDAEAVERLRGQGAILLGKLQTDGFLSGRLEKQSRLASAAVANRVIPFALTVETGGSCLLQGDGRALAFASGRNGVARQGVISCAPSFDRVGFLANTPTDAALLWSVLQDRRTENSDQSQSVFHRVALFGENFFDEERISRLQKDGAELLLTKGAPLERVDLAFRILAATEAASEMALYDGIRFGASVSGAKTAGEQAAESRSAFFSEEEKRLILLGTALLMGEHRQNCYQSARRLRDRIRREVGDWFGACDLMICPLSGETVRLAGLAELAAVAQGNALLVAPKGREALLLQWAERLCRAQEV